MQQRRNYEYLPQMVERVKPPIGTYLIFHKTEASTSAQWVDLARRYLSDATIGAGSNAYFTDLNRGRPLGGGARPRLLFD